ncbi:MAG TPA: hypothetical protein VNG35_00130 [Gemmatimonadales bacterium]|nr:hypothetical protein [Gemmatimonadales bacterium]
MTVSTCVVVRRVGCLEAVVVRRVFVAVARGVATGFTAVAAVDSRDDDDERAADCRLGLDVQAAKPISKSPTRRILDMSPPDGFRNLGAE